MNSDRKQSSISDTISATLLVFLPAAAHQLPTVLSATEQLQGHLSKNVRVIKIKETAHPDVVKSFEVNRFPTFVLICQGIELWRQEGYDSVSFSSTTT
jgi:hypothetical protein